MNLITVDFETYYSKDFGFAKMTTEEYVRHPDFEVIGVGIKENDNETTWYTGTHAELAEVFKNYDWGNSFVLAHNTAFDGAILSWLFGVRPKGWLDTLSMARAIHGVSVGGSLAKLATHYGVGEKGDEVVNALGMRRKDFGAAQLAKYGEYCKNDVDLCRFIFDLMMAKGFPKQELKVIDATLRMFVEPSLELDLPLLEQHLEDVKTRKERLLEAAAADKDALMSNDKFAESLKALGVVPPRKVSPTTGKETWAFAKNDEDFKKLAEHPDVRVQALVSARLGNKSTLEESRTQRFIDVAKRGLLPVPLKYYAAHTGRWGGDDKINLQNLPSRGQNAGKLKKAIRAPKGWVMIDSDSSQIEARTLAWLAGQEDLVDFFRKNNEEIAAGVPKKEMKYDPYKIMAAQIYNKDVMDITDPERFVGKTTILGCFGADTLVLTNSGWKRIVEVLATDTLWDGEEWVTHQGVIPQGIKQTIRALGVDATPDHEILTEHGWRVWSEVTTNHSLIQSAINKGSLLSLTGSSTSNLPADLRGGIPSYGARVDGKGRLIDITSKQDAPQGATHARSRLQTRLVNIIGGTKVSSLTRRIAHACSTVSQAVSRGAIDLLVKRIPIMGGGVSLSTNRGVQIEPHSYATLYHCPDGMTPSATSTVPTTEKDTNPETCGSLHVRKMQETNELQGQCNQRLMTYDIAYAGPRNRYTIATTAGAFIVHNCGYGMGGDKFQAQLKTFNVDIPLEECKRIIDVYRKTYDRIPGLWRSAQNALEAMLTRRFSSFGREGVLQFDSEGYGFILPNGIPLRYAELRKVSDAQGRPQFEYKTRMGWTKIYGGKVVENVCQALARCVIAEQMLKIGKRYKTVLTVHDAVACIARKEEAEEARGYVEDCMRWTPAWATGLPLN